MTVKFKKKCIFHDIFRSDISINEEICGDECVDVKIIAENTTMKLLRMMKL